MSKFYQPPRKITNNTFHLAGIIPVSATMKTDFGMLWPDVMTPLAPNYTMLENAIITAAYAGCESIWIILDAKTIIAFKKLIGDWIRDPCYTEPWLVYKYKEKRIPIIYVPIKPFDYHRRESIPWSIIYGIRVSYEVIFKISRWLTPSAYFVSFPFGVVNYQVLRENRLNISSPSKRFYYSHEGKTVKDGEYLPFKFFFKDFLKFKQKFKDNATTNYEKGVGSLGSLVELPEEQKYSGRFFTLKDIFDIAIISEDDVVVDPNWYFNVGTWEGYKNFLGSEKTKDFVRPSKRIYPVAKRRRWFLMGEDEILKDNQQQEEEKEESKIDE